MSTTAKNATYRKQMSEMNKDLEKFRSDDPFKGTLQEWMKKNPKTLKMRPRDKIKIRSRCKLCGRSRAIYRKFGICRICFRGMASDGLIPGVQKASW